MDDVGESEERSTPATSSTSGIEVGILAALCERDGIDGRSRERLKEGASAGRESARRAGALGVVAALRSTWTAR